MQPDYPRVPADARTELDKIEADMDRWAATNAHRLSRVTPPRPATQMLRITAMIRALPDSDEKYMLTERALTLTTKILNKPDLGDHMTDTLLTADEIRAEITDMTTTLDTIKGKGMLREGTLIHGRLRRCNNSLKALGGEQAHPDLFGDLYDLSKRILVEVFNVRPEDVPTKENK